jgi:hypothetical protein
MIHKLIENLHIIALKLSGQFRTLKKGSESLNISLAHIPKMSVNYSGVNFREAPPSGVPEAYGVSPTGMG